MQKYNPVIIAFFISFIITSCNTGNTRDAGELTKASIYFESTIYDFGTIPYKGDGRCYFDFTNDSDQPLIVNVVRTTCGCTRPEWPEEPVQPGESSRIGISYNTKIEGKFHKSITVYSNTENSPTKLFIKGNVESK